MGKHTPGPWFVKQQATDTPELPGSEQHALVSHVGGGLVAIVALKEMAEVDNANAAMIAAAPELLESLEQAQILLESLGLQSSDEYQANAAAIANAKGEQR